MKPLPPLELLEEFFTYCEKTGNLVRKKTISWRAKEGQVVGSVNRDGYLRVKFQRVEYMVHRIIWKLATKQDIPEGAILDHIDRDRQNNKIENLRLSDNLLNQNNRNPDEGVSYDTREFPKLKKRWVATIRGKKLGYFLTKEEALTARHNALLSDPIRSQLNQP
jgi:hypothetical protein